MGDRVRGAPVMRHGRVAISPEILSRFRIAFCPGERRVSIIAGYEAHDDRFLLRRQGTK
jgi:hypothetical protein